MTLLRPVLEDVGRLVLRGVAAFLVILLLTVVVASAGVRVPFVAGWLLFLYWAAECFAAARRGKGALWGFLVAGPLAFVTLSWIASGYPNAEDPFGFVWATIELFTGLALVTAATGNILLLSTSLPAQPALRLREHS